MPAYLIAETAQGQRPSDLHWKSTQARTFKGARCAASLSQQHPCTEVHVGQRQADGTVKILASFKHRSPTTTPGWHVHHKPT
jgi:hypothetical protein